MVLLKKELEKLKNYPSDVQKPQDFEEFWEESLRQDFKAEVRLELKPTTYPLSQVEVFEASLRAGDGVLLKGLYLRPALNGRRQESSAVSRLLPGLVRFHGYSGNRGQISELLFWALQGYAVLGLDVRGQSGETPDGRVYPTGSFSGWMTLGLDSPQKHYYRQVYLDAARAVEALSLQPEVDSGRIGVFGKSQGGGLAVISAALVNGLGPKLGLRATVKAVSAAIPFLADFRGAFCLCGEGQGPMAELRWYFRLVDPEHKREEQIFEVLDYFDAVNFAPWVGVREIKATETAIELERGSRVGKSLVSIGLKDTSCPPPTIYTLYQALSGEKDLRIYPDYGHESPDEFVDRQIEFLAGELLS